MMRIFTHSMRTVVASKPHTRFSSPHAKGVEGWDDVSVDWAPWREERPIIRARVITRNTRSMHLTPKPLPMLPPGREFEPIHGSKGATGASSCHCSGSVVEREFVWVSTPQFPGSGTFGRRSFGPVGVPVQNTCLFSMRHGPFPCNMSANAS